MRNGAGDKEIATRQQRRDRRLLFRTPLCDQLGIEYPLVLAGMGGVSMHDLVAAVSNAGGLGVIGAATLSAEELQAEISKTRALTDKPFGVDLLMPIPELIEPQMRVIFEEQIAVFVAGLAAPPHVVEEMHRHGTKVVAMVGRVHHARKSVQAGVDIVAAQGTEAGGHTGEIGALALVPQVVDAVDVPVLAAGGIADGRQIVASLALGAQGVVIGTRFVATPEAQAAPAYRAAILRHNEADTIRTRCYTGKPARAVRNRYNSEWERKSDLIQPFPDQILSSIQEGVMDFMGAAGDVDPERCFMPAGQGMGLIVDVKPAAEVVADLIGEAEAVLRYGPFAGNGAQRTAGKTRGEQVR